MNSPAPGDHGLGAGSFADFYRSSAYARFPQEHRSHPWCSFKTFTVDQAAHDFTDIACADWVLGLPLRAACPTRFDYGDGWRRQHRSRGDFLLVPPDTEVRYEISGPTRLLVVTWAGGTLAALDEDLFPNEAAALAPLIGRYFKSNGLEAVCRALWLEMARTDDASRLFLDSALTQLAGTLLRQAAKQPADGPHRRIEVKRVLAFIEANLERDLSLKELASISGLSLFHFVREFRAQIGESPYRFVQRRRAELALQLAACRSLTPTEIASRAGFPSVRAMRAVMQRYTARTQR